MVLNMRVDPIPWEFRYLYGDKSISGARPIGEDVNVVRPAWAPSHLLYHVVSTLSSQAISRIG